MFKNYAKIALRNILRNKVVAAINISGLAIGLACCILILLWVGDEIEYDNFIPNADNIFRISGERSRQTPGPLSDLLKTQYPEVDEAARYVLRLWELKLGDKSTVEEGATVDPSFLKIFSFDFLYGDPKTALDDPNSIVLTKEVSEKIFGDTNPVGKSIICKNRHNLKITGVINKFPAKTHFKFKWLASIEKLKMIWGARDFAWGSNNFITYLSLIKGNSNSGLLVKINSAVQEFYPPENPPKYIFQPLRDIYLHGLQGSGPIKYVYIFSFAAIFILVIACANFTNLSTAGSVKRIKEVALRKVIGAQRKNLIIQFLGESLIISFAALLAAIILFIFLIPIFNDLSGKNLTLDILSESGFWIKVIFVGILTGLIAGTYPALYISSFIPIKLLSQQSSSGKKGLLFRRFLVVGQFSLTIFFLASVFTIHNQLSFIKNKDLGYNDKNIMCIAPRGDLSRNLNTIANELLRNKNIIGLTMTNTLLDASESSSTNWQWEGKDDNVRPVTRILSVTHDFPKVFGTKLAEGRFFSTEFPSDVGDGWVVNEAAVKVMGIESPVGTQMSVRGMNGKIIGVIKDFHYRSLHFGIQPLVIRIIPGWLDNFCIKLSSDDIPGTISFIEETVKKIIPDYQLQYTFLDEKIETRYASEQRMSSIFKCVTLLTILISCSGLFGLALFSTNQRTKEIGIRKTMGASIPAIIILLSKEFLKCIGIAIFIATPVSYLVTNKWLENFVYKINIGIIIYAAAAGLALLIAFLTVSYQAAKAAWANPVDSLKYE